MKSWFPITSDLKIKIKMKEDSKVLLPQLGRSIFKIPVDSKSLDKNCDCIHVKIYVIYDKQTLEDG